ncbi:hypothetical protein KIH77_08105 [Bifidobacterium sp. 82T24]|uniref:hypothetical protein n=1 Tax=Bifidobacterium pluvialisilvae TaxID=2834436 RepID=UPI001C5866CC|nr:hypothetical protein [Bifidobacterium pluvialisilvae]MBW3088688.1 hypothetical protein [Bifidobacterium pluvialisilvae]
MMTNRCIVWLSRCRIVDGGLGGVGPGCCAGASTDGVDVIYDIWTNRSVSNNISWKIDDDDGMSAVGQHRRQVRINGRPTPHHLPTEWY